jgi:hypothetical protein
MSDYRIPRPCDQKMAGVTWENIGPCCVNQIHKEGNLLMYAATSGGLYKFLDRGRLGFLLTATSLYHRLNLIITKLPVSFELIMLCSLERHNMESLDHTMEADLGSPAVTAFQSGTIMRKIGQITCQLTNLP